MAKISAYPDSGSPQPTDQFVIARTGQNFSARWSSMKTAADLTPSSITPTTADVTAAVNTRYYADVSGLTANRNFKLPAGTAGDKIELHITTGDTAYAFIIIGDTGITINGGAAATEWSRVFISGEVVKLIATSASNWQITQDGRKPCVCRVTESAAQTLNDSVATALTYNAATIDNAGGQATLAGSPDGITIRRTGNYAVSSSFQMDTATYTRLLGNVVITGGAELTRAETAGTGYLSLVFVANAYPLTAGNKINTNGYQISGGNRNTVAATAHMEAVEIL